MLEKFKNLSGQLSEVVSGAATSVASTVKEGVGTATNATLSAAQVAGEKVSLLSGKATDAATREAIGQLRNLLAVAADELAKNPVSDKPVTLIARMDVLVAALEVQVIVEPSKQPSGPIADKPALEGPSG